MDAAYSSDLRRILLRLGMPSGHRSGLDVETRAPAPPAPIQSIAERAALPATQPLYFLLAVCNMGYKLYATQGTAQLQQVPER